MDWNERYREGFYPEEMEPHNLVKEFWGEISGRHVLDIAMGSGRNALFLAKKGFLVTGIDSSHEAIKRTCESMHRDNIKMWPVMGDAMHLPYRAGVFDCVMMFYFLQRQVMQNIKMLVKQRGIFMYETFLLRQNRVDRQRNPDHLLRDGELIDYLEGFDLLCYEELAQEHNNRTKIIAKAVGKKK